MELPTVTLKQVLRWSPCYSADKVRAMAGGLTEGTALDMLDLDISDEDKLWLVLRPEVIPEPHLSLIGCGIAENAVRRFWRPKKIGLPREHWRAPQEAIEIKRRHLRGEVTDKELDAAAYRAAAYAADAADAYAAGDPPYLRVDTVAAYSADAAYAAYRAAAYAADATYVAALASAAAVAHAAERRRQVQYVRRYLTSERG